MKFLGGGKKDNKEGSPGKQGDAPAEEEKKEEAP